MGIYFTDHCKPKSVIVEKIEKTEKILKKPIDKW